jgi:hypothetical protein
LKGFWRWCMLYRAIGLVLDFIHRLVCGRLKIPQRFGDWICLRPQVQWLRLAVSNGPSWVGLSCPIHLRTETDPVSKTLWYFLSSTYKTMEKVQIKPNSSVQYTPSSESFQVYQYWDVPPLQGTDYASVKGTVYLCVSYMLNFSHNTIDFNEMWKEVLY